MIGTEPGEPAHRACALPPPAAASFPAPPPSADGRGREGKCPVTPPARGTLGIVVFGNLVPSSHAALLWRRTTTSRKHHACRAQGPAGETRERARERVAPELRRRLRSSRWSGTGWLGTSSARAPGGLLRAESAEHRRRAVVLSTLRIACSLAPEAQTVFTAGFSPNQLNRPDGQPSSRGVGLIPGWVGSLAWGGDFCWGFGQRNRPGLLKRNLLEFRVGLGLSVP